MALYNALETKFVNQPYAEWLKIIEANFEMTAQRDN